MGIVTEGDKSPALQLAEALRTTGLSLTPPEPPAPPEGWRSALPDIADLFLRISLYSDIQIEEWDRDYLERLRRNQYRFDGYCTRCEKDSIFCGGPDPSGQSPTLNYGPAVDWPLANSYFWAQALCQRCGGVYAFYFVLTDRVLSKIGQLPSIEDISAAENVRYRTLMSKGDFADLRRATGLFSHGIGIGSFVYLRRTFERLIEQHRAELAVTSGEIPNWLNMRTADRIKALEAVLPPALVKHRAAYGILSTGIHELDEETCRRYFPVVRSAIVQMLEQDLQRREAAIAEQLLERDLASIQSEIGGAAS